MSPSDSHSRAKFTIDISDGYLQERTYPDRQTHARTQRQSQTHAHINPMYRPKTTQTKCPHRSKSTQGTKSRRTSNGGIKKGLRIRLTRLTRRSLHPGRFLRIRLRNLFDVEYRQDSGSLGLNQTRHSDVRFIQITAIFQVGGPHRLNTCLAR